MKYIIYARKSTESEDRQVLSIDSQVSELRTLAAKEGFVVEKVYTESRSAKAPGRPIFEEMLTFLESNRGEYSLLVWKLDRLARNALDGGKISWFMDRGLIKEIRTWEKTIRNISDDKFFMSLDFGIAKKYVDDLSVNVRRGLRAKLDRGEWPGVAPIGYKNDKASHTIIVDERARSFITRVFELYASTGKSTKEISDILYQEGFRTEKGYKYWKSKIHKILINPFYYGVMEKDGKYYLGNHEPIISKELFDRANAVITGNAHPHPKQHFFRFRGLLTCHVCGCMLTASKKKGHDYYYCTNGKGACEQHKRYLRSEPLDDMVAESLNDLRLDEELIEIAYLAKKEKTGTAEQHHQSAKERLEQELAAVKQKQSRLLDAFIGSHITEETYQEKLQALDREEAGIKSDIKNIGQKHQNGSATLEQVKEILLTDRC
jgi:site-specific DNA recombinase